ncbi:MAG: Tex family protein [bacterium]|nr:Tex family protein [bacterium]
MNDKIINELVIKLNITRSQIVNTLRLLEEGNTIPFIARYRKEATNNLDEVKIKEIETVYTYEVNLLKRKEDVIRLIDEKGLLTDEVKSKIINAQKLVEVEDLYRPYKEKKKTKASDAIANGLEGLAKIILSFPLGRSLEEIADSYSCKISDTDKKLEGASYIIAEYISDNAYYRKWIRGYLFRNGDLVSRRKRTKEDNDPKKLYEMYYDFKEPVKYIKSYRVLAINRGEKENVLSVNIDFNMDEVVDFLSKKVIKNEKSLVFLFVVDAIKDSLKRLIIPSEIREIRNELSERASDVAIDNFSNNLENLLLIPPVKDITVLGFDPAFRTGCKLAVLDKTGKVLDISVIYPHEPQNKREESKKHLKNLIDKYNIDVIAIGNGTASRESELLVAEVIKGTNVKYIIVNEAGASVYSASDLAIAEFPNLNVSERSAISIGRRLQDPLSELVKIDPKSIGVGLYQHDVKQTKLGESLKFTVEKIVNSVGVNINTASKSILSYVSGLTKTTIDKIIKTREELGGYTSRDEIKKIKGISDKVYEQSIGFIRINDGVNPLDKTSIHPESYDIAYKLLEKINSDVSEIGKDKIKERLESVNIDSLCTYLNVDKYTLEDIIKSLKMPILDPRDELDKPLLKSDILTIDNLKEGMKLSGTVRNVIDFGAFVDIGLKNDGLIHISNITDKFIKHPSEVLQVGDIVDCYVLNIDKEKGKVGLSLKESN